MLFHHEDGQRIENRLVLLRFHMFPILLSHYERSQHLRGP